MRRPVDLEEIALRAAVLVMFLGLLGILAALVYVRASETHAQSHCGALGGKVEHYDPQHVDLWRCVGARAEGE